VHLQIGASSVEIEMDSAGSDSHGTQVRRVVLVTGNSWVAASVGISLDNCVVVRSRLDVRRNSLSVFAEGLGDLGGA
jgi:hypothetical protein